MQAYTHTDTHRFQNANISDAIYLWKNTNIFFFTDDMSASMYRFKEYLGLKFSMYNFWNNTDKEGDSVEK